MRTRGTKKAGEEFDDKVENKSRPDGINGTVPYSNEEQEVTMSTEKLSRRKALRVLGLAAAVGYSVPAALMVSGPAKAEDRSRRVFRRTHREERPRRTERSFYFQRRRTGRVGIDIE
jgi:hypothetical protein